MRARAWMPALFLAGLTACGAAAPAPASADLAPPAAATAPTRDLVAEHRRRTPAPPSWPSRTISTVRSANRALDRSTPGADEVASMRLHALWDRAYLRLELGDATADRAFTAYETLAKARSDKDGLAVLTAFFAARRHEPKEAADAAKLVDVAKDSDLQDLYVIALAFDASGDRDRARVVRGRICKGNDYLMKPLILAQLGREGFSCP